MDASQKRFLGDVIFSNTLMATVQRSHVYRPGVDEEERRKLQKDLREQLEEIATRYKEAVDEETHIQNILALSDRLTADHAATLEGGRFRVGTAQKALNLYLKFCWCLGWVPRPPHCPFDSRIIGELREYDGTSWTQLDSVEEYRRLVSAAKAQAGDEPLARWELQVYIGTQTGGQQTEQVTRELEVLNRRAGYLNEEAVDALSYQVTT